MRERFWHLPVKIALPVLMGQFLSDWLWNKNLAEALHRFPIVQPRCLLSSRSGRRSGVGVSIKRTLSANHPNPVIRHGHGK